VPDDPTTLGGLDDPHVPGGPDDLVVSGGLEDPDISGKPDDHVRARPARQPKRV